MGKLGQVDEIADFVVFLLLRRSGVVTGSVIDWDQNVVGGSDVIIATAPSGVPMRIGLIGLGRIGAFHAETLPALRRRRRSSSPTPSRGRRRSGRERIGAEAAATRPRTCWPRASTAW